MASTYQSLHYHLVFGTRNRAPYIEAAWRSHLHNYLGGTIRGLGGFPEGVGGVDDHVHLLVSLKAAHRITDIVQELKKASNRWVHEEIGIREFAWQGGYAVFTVSHSKRDVVKRYIANQERHHRMISYDEEIVTMLEKSGIIYDPRYLG